MDKITVELSKPISPKHKRVGSIKRVPTVKRFLNMSAVKMYFLISWSKKYTTAGKIYCQNMSRHTNIVASSIDDNVKLEKKFHGGDCPLPAPPLKTPPTIQIKTIFFFFDGIMERGRRENFSFRFDLRKTNTYFYINCFIHGQENTNITSNNNYYNATAQYTV